MKSASLSKPRPHPTHRIVVSCCGKVFKMDRLQQISEEIIRLYREQLDKWPLGESTDLQDVDVVEYCRRRERLEELGQELDRMIAIRKSTGA